MENGAGGGEPRGEGAAPPLPRASANPRACAQGCGRGFSSQPGSWELATTVIHVSEGPEPR